MVWVQEMSGLSHSMRTPTLQPVPESLPADHVSAVKKPPAKSGDANSRVSTRRSAEEPHIGKYRLLKTIGKGNFAKVSPEFLKA